MEIERIDPFIALNLLARIDEWKGTPDLWLTLSTREVVEAVEPMILHWLSARTVEVPA